MLKTIDDLCFICSSRSEAGTLAESPCCSEDETVNLRKEYKNPV